MTPTVKWSIVVICLMLMWFSIVALFYLKTDEVTKSPCSVCAKQLGEKVTCTYIDTKSFQFGTVSFLPNGTINDG